MQLQRFVSSFNYLSWGIIRKTLVCAWQKRLIGLSAEIAFHAMLALFPAILALLTAIGLLEESLKQTLPNLAIQLELVIPNQVWLLLDNFADNIRLSGGKSWFSLSFVIAIWISSSALSAAMNAIDEIHGLPLVQRRPFWQRKLVSLLLTVGAILLLVIASFFMFIGDGLVNLVFRVTGASLLLTVWKLLIPPVTLCLVATAFALIYRFGTSQWKRRQPVILGAILAALFWAGLSSLFRLYVANFAYYNKIYGAVGAVIVLMLWLYMSSFVMLLGEQLNTTIGEVMERRRQQE